MPLKKEKQRTIYEACLGRPIRSYQWKTIKEEMSASGLPLTVDNLRFVSKCKRIAPKRCVDAITLKQIMKVFRDLGESVCGVELRKYIFNAYPNISTDKFYRAFRRTGSGFEDANKYQIKDLGETLYLLFSRRRTG